MTELEVALLNRVKELEARLAYLEGELHVTATPVRDVTDKLKVLLYQQENPGATCRQTADAVGLGKTKAAEIINQLKQEGAL